jgi:hypothetical protein
MGCLPLRSRTVCSGGAGGRGGSKRVRQGGDSCPARGGGNGYRCGHVQLKCRLCGTGLIAAAAMWQPAAADSELQPCAVVLSSSA